MREKITRICNLCMKEFQGYKSRKYCDECKSSGRYRKEILNPCKTEYRKRTTRGGRVYIGKDGNPRTHRDADGNKERQALFEICLSLPAHDIRRMIANHRAKLRYIKNPSEKRKEQYILSVLNDSLALADNREDWIRNYKYPVGKKYTEEEKEEIDREFQEWKRKQIEKDNEEQSSSL